MCQAAAAMERKLRFMMDTGLVPKAAQKIDGTFVVDGIDVKRASTEELKNKRDAIINRLGAFLPKVNTEDN